MSETETIHQAFQKLTAKIKHEHDIKENDKTKLLSIVGHLENSWITALKAEKTPSEVTHEPFDHFHTHENKSLKKLVHDTIKSLKKILKEYFKHHPELTVHTVQEPVEEHNPIHIEVDESLLMSSPTKEQEPSSLLLDSALLSKNCTNEHLNLIDQETHIIKLCHLIQALLLNKEQQYSLEAQEALIQECARRMSSSAMQMNVTDIKELKIFIPFIQAASKQVHSLLIAFQRTLSAIKNLLGE